MGGDRSSSATGVKRIFFPLHLPYSPSFRTRAFPLASSQYFTAPSKTDIRNGAYRISIPVPRSRSAFYGKIVGVLVCNTCCLCTGASAVFLLKPFRVFCNVTVSFNSCTLQPTVLSPLLSLPRSIPECLIAARGHRAILPGSLVCRFPRMKRQSQDKVAEYKGAGSRLYYTFGGRATPPPCSPSGCCARRVESYSRLGNPTRPIIETRN